MKNLLNHKIKDNKSSNSQLKELSILSQNENLLIVD